jgi:peroxiredoxin
MKRLNISVFVIFAMLTLALAPSRSSAAAGIEIGATLEDFKLTGTDGKEHSLNGLKGSKGTVIIFLSAQCPVVKGYVSRIDAIASEYKAKGINFIGINSNRRNFESLEWVTSDAAERYKFPVLLDTGNVIADKLGASVTPEVYYFDSKNVLLYKGAIDNDRGGSNVTDPYLKTAFDSALAGKAIERAETKAFGCGIKREGDDAK